MSYEQKCGTKCFWWRFDLHVLRPTIISKWWYIVHQTKEDALSINVTRTCLNAWRCTEVCAVSVSCRKWVTTRYHQIPPILPENMHQCYGILGTCKSATQHCLPGGAHNLPLGTIRKLWTHMCIKQCFTEGPVNISHALTVSVCEHQSLKPSWNDVIDFSFSGNIEVVWRAAKSAETERKHTCNKRHDLLMMFSPQLNHRSRPRYSTLSDNLRVTWSGFYSIVAYFEWWRVFRFKHCFQPDWGVGLVIQ